MKELFLAAWAYRHFILSSIRGDLRIRFVRSKLGGLWMIIHPLAQVLIFAIVLSEVLSAKLPGIGNKHAYALYLMAGILCWSLIAETLSKCLNLFIENGNLMKKMAFPRICLPLIAAGTVLVNNFLLLVAVFAVFAALGHYPGQEALWLPILMGVTLLFSLGLGLLLGVLNVFLRDIGQIVPVLLQVLFWLTPIVYTLNVLPARYQCWFEANPVYGLVASYQNIMVFDAAPLWSNLLWVLGSAIVLLLIGLVAFRRASPEMVDAL